MRARFLDIGAVGGCFAVQVLATSVGFGGLFFEEFVDCFHLGGVSDLDMGRDGREAYFFFLVALLAQVLSSAGHFGAAHGVFFCC